MNKCILLRWTLCVLSIGFSASAAGAQPGAARFAELPVTLSESTTVLTMAPDGSFGAATDVFVNRAIARAIASCRAMSRRELGCGALFVTVQAGWSLGVRCGGENIVAAATDLSVAEGIAARREADLREFYVPDLPACRRIVTIDPTGRIVLPKVDSHLASTPAPWRR